MLRPSLFRSFSVLLGAFLISSCSDSAMRGPTAPIDATSAQSSDPSLKGTGLAGHLPDPGNLELKALWWRKNHNDVVQVSMPIGPSGGTITLPATGLTIVFPAGALTETLPITVTSDDKYVAYKMEPSGTTFAKDVTVTQLLGFTELAGSPLRTQIFAAYVADDNLRLSGKVPVLEIEPSRTILSAVTGLPQAQVWVIRHFSRYMLSSG
jgi:hypothetical protein